MLLSQQRRKEVYGRAKRLTDSAGARVAPRLGLACRRRALLARCCPVLRNPTRGAAGRYARTQHGKSAARSALASRFSKRRACSSAAHRGAGTVVEALRALLAGAPPDGTVASRPPDAAAPGHCRHCRQWHLNSLTPAPPGRSAAPPTGIPGCRGRRGPPGRHHVRGRGPGTRCSQLMAMAAPSRCTPRVVRCPPPPPARARAPRAAPAAAQEKLL